MNKAMDTFRLKLIHIVGIKTRTKYKLFKNRFTHYYYFMLIKTELVNVIMQKENVLHHIVDEVNNNFKDLCDLNYCYAQYLHVKLK